MPNQVKYTNKKTGVTYLYESVSYWDKEKKQPRNKRICVGKIDNTTGELVPSKRIIPVPGETDAITATTRVIGPIQVLDALDKQSNVSKLLKKSFPVDYQKIQIMAYYLVMNGAALSHCESWCYSHFPEFSTELSSQRIADILHNMALIVNKPF